MKYHKRFRVEPGSKVRLDEIDPSWTDPRESHEAVAEEMERDRDRLRSLQERLHADGRRALLICLQGMDASGKDGAVKHLLGAMNPQGCSVSAFKQPSEEELAHDFLWRIHRVTPPKGGVTVFNRSHYEDVLVVRVDDLVPKDVWSGRYEHINAFERGLVDGNTDILKFYLHISKDEQIRRFEERIDDPTKRWKISAADYKGRKSWDKYMTAYDEALSRCSTKHAPWYVIPSNHKWYRDLAIARVVIEHLERLDLKFPKPSLPLDRIRREYQAAKRG